MATPMHVYAEIAARYGVDPSDDDAVDSFFIERAARLPVGEQELIASELFGRDGEVAEPVRQKYMR